MGRLALRAAYPIVVAKLGNRFVVVVVVAVAIVVAVAVVSAAAAAAAAAAATAVCCQRSAARSHRARSVMLEILLSARSDLLGRRTSGAHRLARQIASFEPNEQLVEPVLYGLLRARHAARLAFARLRTRLELGLGLANALIDVGLSTTRGREDFGRIH